MVKLTVLYGNKEYVIPFQLERSIMSGKVLMDTASFKSQSRKYDGP
jgi:hypothetical protein